MQHNRPYYGKKVLLIFPCTGYAEALWYQLPRWMEQIYDNVQIVLCYSTHSNITTAARVFAERLSWTVSHDFTSDIILINSKFDLSLLPQWIENSQADVVAIANPQTCPAPYFLDICMMSIDEKHAAGLGKTCVFPKKLLPKYLDGTIDMLPVSASAIFGEIENPAYPRMTLYIPSMDRTENTLESLPHWFRQRYPNLGICIIDYNSEIPMEPAIREICEKYEKTFSTNPEAGSDVTLLRLNNLKHFNICHAYNYGIRMVPSEIISTTCADSCGWDYMTEAVFSCCTSERIVQLHWGLHTLYLEAFRSINGHSESQIVGWGHEDEDFRIRATLIGLEPVILPSKLVYQIPTDHLVKSKNRQVKDLSESSLTNYSRCQSYIAHYGPVANYGEPIGQDQPVAYRKPCSPGPDILRMWVWREPAVEGPEISFHPDFKLYYRISKTDWEPKDFGINAYEHFYLTSSFDVDKYLFNCHI